MNEQYSLNKIFLSFDVLDVLFNILNQKNEFMDMLLGVNEICIFMINSCEKKEEKLEFQHIYEEVSGLLNKLNDI